MNNILPNVEFVITAPEEYSAMIAYENSVRQTHGVLIDMFKEAKDYILLSAPYLKDLELSQYNINLALRNALARKISVTIISTISGLKSANISQYKGLVRLYVPATNYEDQNTLGSHAKFCIVDGHSIYLGSANFTFYGLNKHFEMGIFTRGKLVKQVENFLLYLKEKEYLINCTKDFIEY